MLRRVVAARGVRDPAELDHRLSRLRAPDGLADLERACALLDDAIEARSRIVVAGDYDADGATATAVAVRGLRALGAHEVHYRVPDRQRHGYGLTPAFVATLAPLAPALLVTVDNGIASHAGVDAARALGYRVLVTDHHLPGATLPRADAIVDPARADCGFGGRCLAGVGVMFYVLTALRAHRRQRGRYRDASEPELASLLEWVALGTVADLVPLDANNRVLVAAGLRRMREGRASAGIAALAEVAGVDLARIDTTDLAFRIAPRLNAAGRLDDMALGIATLLATDASSARRGAQALDAINRERRLVQARMVDEAQALIDGGERIGRSGVVVFDPGWHPGVIGLVATRLRERLNRPVFAFAPADDGSWRGSGRSIDGLHLRDALADVDATEPGLLERYGGHAMAAGLSLAAGALPRFAAAFDRAVEARLGGAPPDPCFDSDGSLEEHAASAELATLLREAAPWGQGFPRPAFDDVFDVTRWRVVGEAHLKFELRDARGAPLEAIAFGAWTGAPPPTRIHAGYELGLDHWRGEARAVANLRVIHPM